MLFLSFGPWLIPGIMDKMHFTEPLGSPLHTSMSSDVRRLGITEAVALISVSKMLHSGQGYGFEKPVTTCPDVPCAFGSNGRPRFI